MHSTNVKKSLNRRIKKAMPITTKLLVDFSRELFWSTWSQLHSKQSSKRIKQQKAANVSNVTKTKSLQNCTFYLKCDDGLSTSAVCEDKDDCDAQVMKSLLRKLLQTDKKPNSHRLDGNKQRYYSMHSLHIKSKPIAAHLLNTISNLLKEEHIDLTEEPYSDCSGFCGIPPALIQRYAEEANEDIYDVADAVDHLRLGALVFKGRIGIPNDFLADSCTGPVIEQANCDSLRSWLVSIGLPMCEQLLVNNGYTELTQLSEMTESDLLACGITKASHRRLLTNAICAFSVN